MSLRTLAAALAGALLASAALPAQAAAPDRKLVLVTLDGLPWTEVFRGANPERAADPAFVGERDAIKKDFLDPDDRRRALMPFLTDVVAKDGVLIGDRDHGSCAAVSNDQWFSYPGYNEILTGKPDPAIRSNEHGPNRNVTFLEWLNQQPAYKGKVEVVASWAAYADILNAPRSGLPINDGWDDAPARTPAEAAIARIQAGAPRIWLTVRQDIFTQAYALEALKTRKPKVLYVAFGETDDFAHDGHYDQTLWAARRADAFIAELWKTLQADKTYAGKTTLIITTDHGRGNAAKDSWKHHARPFAGSNEVWIGALGPGVVKGGPISGGCASSSQVAATALTALGLDWKTFDATAGAPLEILR